MLKIMKLSLLAEYPNLIEEVAKWYYNEWAKDVPNVTVDHIINNLSKAQNVDKIPLLVVAHKEKEFVGAAELKFRENKNYLEYEHWIGGVFVKPEFRGQGISKALIKEVKQHSKRLKVQKLYLQCKSKYKELYSKFGFIEIHKENKNGIKKSIMVCAI